MKYLENNKCIKNCFLKPFTLETSNQSIITSAIVMGINIPDILNSLKNDGFRLSSYYKTELLDKPLSEIDYYRIFLLCRDDSEIDVSLMLANEREYINFQETKDALKCLNIPRLLHRNMINIPGKDYSKDILKIVEDEIYSS